MKTRKPSREDVLVNSITAFFTWADMLKCLRDGYVPTLRRSRSCQKLARIVRAHGFKVFQYGRVF